MIKKTPMYVDPVMRAKEEFAEYWPDALERDKGHVERTLGIPLYRFVDVFRAVYVAALVKGAALGMEEASILDAMRQQRDDPS